MNFGELKTFVQDILGRTDIPAAAYALAQDDWTRRLRLQGDQVAVSLASPYTLPAAFVSAVDVRFNDVRLNPVTVFPDYDSSGTPDRYRITGGAFVLWPTTTDPIDILYVAKATTLTNASDTSSVLTRFANVAIYGSVFHCCTLLRDDAGQAAFGPMYQQALAEAVKEEQRQRFGGGPLVPTPREVA